MNNEKTSFEVYTEKTQKEAVSWLYRIRTDKEYEKRFSNKPKGLKTGLFFDGRKRSELLIKYGAITMIGALTSHGKSSLLRNLALSVAKDGNSQGDVIYLTFEESEEQTYLRFLNTYIGKDISIGEKDNQETLEAYFHNEIELSKGIIKQKEKFSEIINSGSLRILSPEIDSNAVLTFLGDYEKETGRKIKAVFLDYIQYLYKSGNDRQRNEQLKAIVSDFNDFAKRTNVPVISAVQLGKGATSPAKLSASVLADSYDLARYSDTIVCLFLDSKPEDITDDKYIYSDYYKDLKERGFEAKKGGEGRIYAKLVKNRGGISGIDAVWNFDGNSGKITSDDF